MADRGPAQPASAGFESQAEGARLRIQALIADEAGKAGDLSSGEVKALVWAMLSGAITAVGHGFAGLVQRGIPAGASEGAMLQALHDQLDSAVSQSKMQRSRAND